MELARESVAVEGRSERRSFSQSVSRADRTPFPHKRARSDHLWIPPAQSRPARRFRHHLARYTLETARSLCDVLSLLGIASRATRAPLRVGDAESRLRGR